METYDTIKNKNVIKFIDYVKGQSQLFGVKFDLRDTDYVVLNNVHCAGYFSTDLKNQSPELVVALKDSRWLQLLVHESCHMDQWAEKSKLWEKATAMDKIDNWLNGIDYPTRHIRNTINIIRDLELDCERRTVKKIIDWKLPVDIDLYIRKANVYIFFHNYLKVTRKWKHPDYDNPNVYLVAAKKWYKNYKYVPQKLRKMFDEHLGLKE